MISFLLPFSLSIQVFDITPDSIKNLILYFNPRDCIEVDVDSQLQTYFSNINKAKGLSVEIRTNDSSTFGPFNHHAHLDGINFQEDKTDYQIIFTNEGDHKTQLAIVFANNLEESFAVINHNFTKFDFPIINYRDKKFTYFSNGGLIFHEKKYSTAFFIGVPVALGLIFIVTIFFGIPSVVKCCCDGCCDIDLSDY